MLTQRGIVPENLPPAEDIKYFLTFEHIGLKTSDWRQENFDVKRSLIDIRSLPSFPSPAERYISTKKDLDCILIKIENK